MTRRSPIFLIFLNFLQCFQKPADFVAAAVRGLGFEPCKSVVDSVMECLPVKIKSIFSENNGQAMEDPQFKFQPVPAESA